MVDKVSLWEMSSFVVIALIKAQSSFICCMTFYFVPNWKPIPSGASSIHKARRKKGLWLKDTVNNMSFEVLLRGIQSKGPSKHRPELNSQACCTRGLEELLRKHFQRDRANWLMREKKRKDKKNPRLEFYEFYFLPIEVHGFGLNFCVTH